MNRIKYYIAIVAFIGGFFVCGSLGVSASSGTDTMVGYWKLDETTAGETVVDSSGDGNNGTTAGSAAPSSTVPAAIQFTNARSRQFDGVDDYINIPDATNLQPGNGSWTVSVWANPANTDQSKMIVGKRRNSGTFEQWSMWICGDMTCSTSGQRLSAFYIEEGGVIHRDVSTTTVDVVDGNWHMFTMVADKGANVVKLYIDGTLQTVDTNANGVWPTIDNTDPVRIGNNNGSAYFNGYVDDVRVYNRALSSTEISALASGVHTSATWTGSSSSNYEVAGNWDVGVIPDPYTQVTIASASNYSILSANIAVSSLTINSGATLDLAGYTVTYNDGGTLTNNGTLYTNGPLPTSTPAPTATSAPTQSSSDSQSSAPTCTDAAPVGKPDLFQIDTKQNEVVLHFTTVKVANRYLVFYGTTTAANEFGDTFNYSGNEWLLTRSIKNLTMGKTYYFRVQAARGCAGGESSSIISATLRSVVPIASNTTIVPTIVPTPTLKPMVIESTEIKPVISPTDAPKVPQEGYRLDVKVVDDGKPIGGVEVTLHSFEQKAVTDDMGVARFANVEEGDHELELAYNSYYAKQSLKVEGDDLHQEITIEVNMVQVKSWKDWLPWLVGGSMLGILITVLFVGYRKRV